MATDTEDPDVDSAVADFTSTDTWKDADMNQRRDYVRKFSVAGRSMEAPSEFHDKVTAKLYDKADDQGFLKWIGNAAREAAWGTVSSIGATSVGAADTAGLTDSGSGQRLKAGFKQAGDSIVQRAKAVLPDDEQEKRDEILSLFKQDIDEGRAPAGLNDYLAGEDQDNASYKEASDYLDNWKDVILRQTVAADEGPEAVEKETDIPGVGKASALSSYKSSGRSLYDTDRSHNLLADYIATRDPSSWDALQDLATETKTQWGNRLKNNQTTGAQIESHIRAKAAEEGRELTMGEEAVVRSMGMQQSPVDMALSIVPFLKGVKALKAAKAGDKAGALKQALQGAVVEGVEEGTSALLDDPRNTAAQVGEQFAAGMVGGGAISGTGAAIGATTRALTPKKTSETPIATAAVQTTATALQTDPLTEQTGKALEAIVADDLSPGDSADALPPQEPLSNEPAPGGAPGELSPAAPAPVDAITAPATPEPVSPLAPTSGAPPVLQTEGVEPGVTDGTTAVDPAGEPLPTTPEPQPAEADAASILPDEENQNQGRRQEVLTPEVSSPKGDGAVPSETKHPPNYAFPKKEARRV